MKSIEEYTNYLFNCKFTDESFDPEDHEDHLKTAWELFDNYAWESIYPVWMKYLHTNCPTPEDVINFVNLYTYYAAAEHPIEDPIGFISYLYFRVDMDQYWDDAGELFDGLSINILSKKGIIDMMADPYYSPLKDERILGKIEDLKRDKSENASQ